MNKTFAQRVCAMVLALLSICTLFLTGCKDEQTEPTTPPVTAAPVEPTEPEPTTTEPIEGQEWQGIDASSFTKFATDFSGEIDGVSFTGVLLQNKSANSTTYFTKPAVIEIWKYARANGYDALRVHIYVKQKDNGFQIDDQIAPNGQWSTLDIPMANLDSLTVFKSRSTGAMENYLWFEFSNLPVINSTSFTGGVSPFKGTIGGKEFQGFVFKSREYQPSIYFQDYTIEDMKAYAKENGFNALRVSCYPIQMDNAYMVGGNSFPLNQWKSVDFSVEHITGEFTFWSQSQGTTENYMIFEFVNSKNPVIPSGKTGPKKPSSPYFTSEKGFAVEAYKGTIEDIEFNGFRFTSTVYQPDFYFTAKAVDEIRAAAETSGNNFIRIHAYVKLKDNAFVVGGKSCGNNKWSTVDFHISEISTKFRFWSQSQGATEVYLWFEMYRLDIPDATSEINASYFTPMVKNDGTSYKVSFKDYRGTAGEQAINGIKITSTDYQPKFKFTAEAIASIKEYAQKHNVNFMRVHAYATLYDNAFVAGGKNVGNKKWGEIEVYLPDLTENFTFWSQSQGSTEIYMWFEFYKEDVPDATSEINASYFEAMGTGDKVTFSNYRGTAGEQAINGVKVTSTDYQPKFKFTAEGIESIKEYAEAHGVNCMKIHAYAILYDNAFVVNGKGIANKKWGEVEVYLPNLTEDFTFWSQSQGATEIYMWFEFGQAPIIDANSFKVIYNDRPVRFENYEGTVEGVNFSGIMANSSAYQPGFTFTEAGLARVNAHAQENGYNYLIIHLLSQASKGGPNINGEWLKANQWNEYPIKLSDLTTSTKIWHSSDSGTVTNYLWFEFKRIDTIRAESFESTDVVFEDYEGNIGEQDVFGVKASSNTEFSSAKLTEVAITEIQEYTAQNFLGTVKISVYPISESGTLRINDTVLIANQWNEIMVAVKDLEALTLTAENRATAWEAYLMFEFVAEKIIESASFSGVFTVEAFAGTVAEEEIAGFKVTCTGRKRDNFTAEAIEKIQAYATANGYTELKIRVYATLDNNAFTVFGQSVIKDQWNEITVPVDSLTTSLRIQTTCTGNTEAYFVFEFQ